jgi:ADP-heptose:LPS heptosyltransferase
MREQVGHDRCVNFAGRLSLEELPALYQLAEVMLTNDSGPGHFSAVTALRTFVIFGPETPHLYGSLGDSTPLYAGLACSPCVSAANHRKTPCTDNVCLQVIRPEQVLELLRKALDSGRPAVQDGPAA